MQADLFSDSGPQFESFELPDAVLWLKRGFLAPDVAQSLFDELQATTAWEQDSIRMYGRELLSPRLTAWFGDSGCEYVYSGVKHKPLEWTSALHELKQLVEQATGARFNSALQNLYRNGQDSVAWHSDDEPELGLQPAIASLSLGAERTFQLKHKSLADLPRVDLQLPAGSLLWMAGDCQRCWLHRVPKRTAVKEARINVTFRRIE